MIKNITENFILSNKRRERYLRLWEPGGQPLVRAGVVAAGVADLVPPYDIQRKDSPFHVVMYTFSGSGRCATTKAPAGKLFVMPAGEQHYWSDEPWNMIWFHIQRGVFPGLDAVDKPGLLIFRDAEQLKRLMTAYCDEQDGSRSHALHAQEQYAELIRIHLSRNLEEHTDPLEVYNSRQLRVVWAEVEAQPADPWRVDDLARLFGLSPVQFYRIVVKHEGMPPMSKVQDIRLKQAAEALLHSNQTLESLAEMVGFQSPFSLSRAFKQRFGLSPRHFKQHHLAKEPHT